jgi:uncharacterized protein (TIGR03067 family)
MRKSLLVLVAALTLGFAAAPFRRPDKPVKLDPNKVDLKLMQGEWELLGAEKITKGGPPKVVVVGILIVGDQIKAIDSSGGEPEAVGRISLDAAKQPKQFQRGFPRSPGTSHYPPLSIGEVN